MSLFFKKKKKETPEVSLQNVLDLFEAESGTFIPASPYVTVASRCIFSSNRQMEDYVYNKYGVPEVMPGSKFKPFFFVSYNFPHLTQAQMEETVAELNRRFDNRFQTVTPIYRASTGELLAYSLKNSKLVRLDTSYNA